MFDYQTNGLWSARIGEDAAHGGLIEAAQLVFVFDDRPSCGAMNAEGLCLLIEGATAGSQKRIDKRLYWHHPTPTTQFV